MRSPSPWKVETSICSGSPPEVKSEALELGLERDDAAVRACQSGGADAAGVRSLQHRPVDVLRRDLAATQQDQVDAGLRGRDREAVPRDAPHVSGPVERVGHAHAAEAELVPQE